jgi:hypothetical protein
MSGPPTNTVETTKISPLQSVKARFSEVEQDPPHVGVRGEPTVAALSETAFGDLTASRRSTLVPKIPVEW